MSKPQTILTQTQVHLSVVAFDTIMALNYHPTHPPPPNQELFPVNLPYIREQS